MNQGPLFNEENIAGLLSHLADGSLAQELVSGASTATTRPEVEAALAGIIRERLNGVQEKLDGGS